MKDDVYSPYIMPFLGKNNEDLLKAMKEHQNHQYPLSKEQERLEGMTLLYAQDEKFYGRR